MSWDASETIAVMSNCSASPSSRHRSVHVPEILMVFFGYVYVQMRTHVNVMVCLVLPVFLGVVLRRCYAIVVYK